MRAKTINEKFNKESDPIHDLDIGGINFQDEFDDAYYKWYNFIKKTLEGKTITAYIEKHYTIGHKIMTDKGDMTIKVKSVDYPTSDSFGGGHPIWFKLYFYGEDGIRYSMELDQKIKISQ